MAAKHGFKTLIEQLAFASLLIGAMPICQIRAQDENATLDKWFAAQTNIQTWSADFTQTRTLKAFEGPLTSTGHVWFAAPNRFRWETRAPVTNIAVRQGDRMLVIAPRLKRVEEYSLNEVGQWKDTLALMDAGFPRSRAEVESRFDIIGQSSTNGLHEITLRPKSQSAREFMPQIRIAFDDATLQLRSTELSFADGSTMRNTFTHAVLNPRIDDSIFSPKIEPDYKVTKPLSNGR